MTLDEKDKEILKLYAEGFTTKEIAAQLCLSNRTVEKRIEVMKERNKCKSRTQLVVRFVLM